MKIKRAAAIFFAGILLASEAVIPVFADTLSVPKDGDNGLITEVTEPGNVDVEKADSDEVIGVQAEAGRYVQEVSAKVGGNVSATNTNTAGTSIGISNKASNELPQQLFATRNTPKAEGQETGVAISSTVSVDGNVTSGGGATSYGVRTNAYAEKAGDSAETTTTIGGSVEVKDASSSYGVAAAANSEGAKTTTEVGGGINVTGSSKSYGVVAGAIKEGAETATEIKEGLKVESGSAVGISLNNSYGQEVPIPLTGTNSVTVGGDVKVTGNVDAVGIETYDGSNTVDIGGKLTVTGGEEATTGIDATSNGDTISITVAKGIEVSGDYVSGIATSTGNNGELNIYVKEGGVTATSNSGMAAALQHTIESGTFNASVIGDVSSTELGIIIEKNDLEYIGEETAEPKEEDSGSSNGVANILIDGTLSADKGVPVLVSDNVTEDNLKLTVWEIVPNANGNVIETEQHYFGVAEEDDEIAKEKEAIRALEKSIQYIIRVEDPMAGATVNLGGTTKYTDKLSNNSYDVAHETETVTLKVTPPSGYELAMAYNGEGKAQPLSKDPDGNYYIVVPRGGGVYLSVEFSKLPEEPKKEEPKKEEPKKEEAKKSTSTGSRSSSESHTRMGYWRQDAKGWYYQFLSGGYAKNAVINIDAYSSGGYTPGWYGFGDDGYMKTGWALINGNWYYFDQNGLMRTGWSNINGKDYYFNPGVVTSGSMSLPVGALYVNTTTPDGHRVDESGAKI